MINIPLLYLSNFYADYKALRIRHQISFERKKKLLNKNNLNLSLFAS